MVRLEAIIENYRARQHCMRAHPGSLQLGALSCATHVCVLMLFVHLHIIIILYIYIGGFHQELFLC